MAVISVTREYEFAAAHHLPNHKGKCRRPHGHNYVLEVEVAGEIGGLRAGVVGGSQSSDGMVIDFEDLDDWVNSEVIKRLDHQDLNDAKVLPYQPPTAEMTASWIWDALYQDLYSSDLRLVRVRLYETSKSWAEVKE
jgi:6-pyruvoyltetrahydropterin/6-carboxytetrahydropterin synthase